MIGKPWPIVPPLATGAEERAAIVAWLERSGDANLAAGSPNVAKHQWQVGRLIGLGRHLEPVSRETDPEHTGQG